MLGCTKVKIPIFIFKKGFNVVAFEANPSLIEHCKKYSASKLIVDS